MTVIRTLTPERRTLALVAVLVAYVAVTAVSYRYADDTPIVGGLPYLPVAGAFVLVAAGVSIARWRRLPPLGLLAAVAYGVAAATALLETGADPMRDLDLYLTAGRRFLAGEPVYLTAPLMAAPLDPSALPFLYPPPLVPLFAALSAVPEPLAYACWAAASVAAMIVAVRLIGVAPLWIPALLLWRPAFDGIWAGNVAPFVFLLFAVGPWIGAALPLSASFKVYNAIAALWLIRMRRWRSIAVAGLIVALAVAFTLPLTGVELWGAWLMGVAYYRDSEAAVPGLSGMSLWSYLPAAVALVIGAVVTLAALHRRAARAWPVSAWQRSSRHRPSSRRASSSLSRPWQAPPSRWPSARTSSWPGRLSGWYGGFL
jgi:hypothetical protein